MACFRSFFPDPSSAVALLEKEVAKVFLKHYGISPPVKRLFVLDEV